MDEIQCIGSYRSPRSKRSVSYESLAKLRWSSEARFFTFRLEKMLSGMLYLKKSSFQIFTLLKRLAMVKALFLTFGVVTVEFQERGWP